MVGGSLQLDVKEILAYSIWGGLAYHEYYQEGFTPKLETTENYSYNSKGQLVVFYIKDEVQELLTRYIRYEYAPAGAAKNSAIAYAPLQLNNTSISSVLAEIEFSHTVFDRISKSHSLTTGN